MKIAVCSDLHLEFGPLTLENNEAAEVLILGGDIIVAKYLDYVDDKSAANYQSVRFHEFFQNCCEQFPHVIFIMGNHCHYHGDFATTYTILKDRLGYLQNLYILDKETVTLEGVTFVGGTLWTDMNDEDPMTLNAIGSMMNDFRCVKNSNKKVSFRDADGNFHERVAKFSPEDAVEDHKKMVDYIRHVVEGKDDQKFVVVGHHAPSKLSTHPKYQNETLMNGGYSSTLDFFIEAHPQIKLWTHGHTHEIFDYVLNQTRIVCNPRGYIGYEDRADAFKLKTFEV